MKILKSRILLVIVTAIIFSSITALAYNISANEISYENGTVKDALDSLYNIEATQVATLTTRGATYTMQNDGYIIGTAQGTSTTVATVECSDGKTYILTNEGYTGTRNVSLFIEKGVTVQTRSSSGTYNLTVYEWK